MIRLKRLTAAAATANDCRSLVEWAELLTAAPIGISFIKRVARCLRNEGIQNVMLIEMRRAECILLRNVNICIYESSVQCLLDEYDELVRSLLGGVIAVSWHRPPKFK